MMGQERRRERIAVPPRWGIYVLGESAVDLVSGSRDSRLSRFSRLLMRISLAPSPISTDALDAPAPRPRSRPRPHRATGAHGELDGARPTDAVRASPAARRLSVKFHALFRPRQIQTPLRLVS